MKKRIISILLACTMVVSMAACNKNSGDESKTSGDSGSVQKSTEASKSGDNSSQSSSSELENGRFDETRQITVEIYDRANDGGSDPENNIYTE